MEVESFRSPMKKFLRFFVRSLAGWKGKCQHAKTRVKRLGNRAQKLTTSRERWRERAPSLASELARVDAELQALKTG